MFVSTSKLVAIATKAALPATVASAFVLGAALFIGAGGVHAAIMGSGGITSGVPLDDSSVSALTALDHAMEAVTSKVTPSIVNIDVTSKVSPDEQSQNQGPGQGGQQMQLPPGFSQFFGGGNGMQMQPQQPQIEHGIGSGVIISPDGYIITNNHVVQGATKIRVTLSDRRVFTGKVVGTDKLTDIAVVKIDATNLRPIAWGDSTKLEPGQTVLAFGSPFGSLRFSVTRGIVSALGRQDPFRDDARKPENFIQTDAAINPGNSGGALVDSHGELIGINQSIITNSGSFAGAGFAIPSQIAQSVASQLIAHGKVEHGYLGISMNDVTPENAHFFALKDASGAIVAQVTPDSPAAKAGMQQGDVITSYNGHNILNGSDLQVAVSEMRPGTALKLEVMRNGTPVNLNLTVGEFHPTPQVASTDQDDQQGGQPGHAGKLGLAVANLDDQARQQVNAPENLHGVVVENVRPDSPADDAGLQPGDVILQVNRKPATTADAFLGAVHAAPQNQDLLLLVWSKGNASYRTIHPTNAPDNQNGE
jgi:serine protease Do